MNVIQTARALQIAIKHMNRCDPRFRRHLIENLIHHLAISSRFLPDPEDP